MIKQASKKAKENQKDERADACKSRGVFCHGGMLPLQSYDSSDAYGHSQPDDKITLA